MSVEKKLFLLFVLGILLLVGCGTKTPAELSADLPQQPVQAGEWIEIKTWEGQGSKYTEKFQISGSEWRVNWKGYDEIHQDLGIIQIFVYDDSGDMVALIANTQGISEDVSYVHTPGSYYLWINSANINWKVTVDEYK